MTTKNKLGLMAVAGVVLLLLCTASAMKGYRAPVEGPQVRPTAEQITVSAEAEKAAALKKQAEQAERQKQAKVLLASLSKKADDMRGVVWYQDPVVGKQVFGKYARFCFGADAATGHTSALRFQVQWEGSSWIFAEKLLIKADDTLYELGVSYFDWKHENSGGKVWESLDVPISQTHPEIATALATAKTVKIRFEGKEYASDFVVPQKQREALARVYQAWEGNAVTR